MPDLLQVNDSGLYCAVGDFYIDPWRAVSRAVITHAHSDHARSGMSKYFCARPGVAILQARVGRDAVIHPLDYGATQSINGVQVSLHPAGHVLGSAQVRVEYRGEVWVASGDYKIAADPTCAPFEPIRCHTFITESTFGLPIYCWESSKETFAQINHWWANNIATGRTSLLYGYSLGKAQRLLAGLDPSLGPILVHSTIAPVVQHYRDQGITLPTVDVATVEQGHATQGRAMVITPPTAQMDQIRKHFGDVATATASGWMQVRRARQRQSHDQGFILSDHADWPGLLSAIAATGAERILVTHGYTAALSRYLCEQGYNACALMLLHNNEVTQVIE